jgi:hypothetical protein
MRGLDWTWVGRWEIGPFAHIRVHLSCLWWGSRLGRRLLVVTGARCPLTKPPWLVAAVELRVDHRAPLPPGRGVQPGGIYACVVHREPTPADPGSGLRRSRRRFLCQLPSRGFLFFFCGRIAVCIGDLAIRLLWRVRIFDEHPFTSRPTGRYDRGAEGHRTDMTHALREHAGGNRAQGSEKALGGTPKQYRLPLPGPSPLCPGRRAPAGFLVVVRRGSIEVGGVSRVFISSSSSRLLIEASLLQ